MTAIRNRFRHQTGDVVPYTGDVTQLSAVFNRTPQQIERALGYESGRLRDGWCLMLLIDEIRAREFIWADTTRFSGGFDYDPEIGECVHRMDSRRGRLLVHFGSDAGADSALDPFQTAQQQLLNARIGEHRICKVIPNVPHVDKRDWWVQYPNSEVAGIRQWKLLVPKRMRCAATLAPNETFSVPPLA